jgi:hemerythrin-like domain-containing protein
MMYVAHDAFLRDLRRLTEAAESGQAWTAEGTATWQMFTRQLSVHHQVEDRSLWPRLRAAVASGDEVEVLEAMEAEHALLDPLIVLAGQAVADRDAGALASRLGELSSLLADHTRHEEQAALPLVQRYLSTAGWDAFGADIRRAVGGVRGGALYFPWVLDDAPQRARDAALKVLPPPVRVILRVIWEPRYRRTPHLA